MNQWNHKPQYVYIHVSTYRQPSCFTGFLAFSAFADLLDLPEAVLLQDRPQVTVRHRHLMAWGSVKMDQSCCVASEKTQWFRISSCFGIISCFHIIGCFKASVDSTKCYVTNVRKWRELLLRFTRNVPAKKYASGSRQSSAKQWLFGRVPVLKVLVSAWSWPMARVCSL